MSDLEMIQAFAELEGVDVAEYHGMILPMHTTRNVKNPLITGAPYNPITDLALNCAARDKYGVSVQYHGDGGGFVGFEIEELGFVLTKRTAFDVREEIPRAVIECILKRKGKL